MTTDRNLDLDVDLEEGGARVMVSAAWAFTRHDGDPVISNECQSFAEIDREISRLESELEDVRARAREHFGDARPPEASTEPASAPRPTRHCGSPTR
jgi:hypothetical protein